MLDEINERFGSKRVEANSYSPLALAYIGDSVFDVVVKTVLVEDANRQVNKLHRACSRYVKAKAQADMADQIMPHLDEEEQNIMKRGRNAKPYTKAKNASYGEYCKATGLEALIGYLYLLGRISRMIEIIKEGMELIDEQDMKGAVQEANGSSGIQDRGP